MAWVRLPSRLRIDLDWSQNLGQLKSLAVDVEMDIGVQTRRSSADVSSPSSVHPLTR